MQQERPPLSAKHGVAAVALQHMVARSGIGEVSGVACHAWVRNAVLLTQRWRSVSGRRMRAATAVVPPHMVPRGEHG